jgi:phage terminase large subunit GpA-like protein
MNLTPLKEAVAVGLSGLTPKPRRSLSQWAAEHFYLSQESSYVEGAWKAWPFQAAILDAMGSDEVAEVDIIKSARVGYSKMLLACIFYQAQHKVRNQGIWQPTDSDAVQWCKTELDTALRDMPIMATVFPQYLRRHRNNTLEQKQFLGSMLYIRGGKAAKNYRRITLDTVYLDELDGFDYDVDNEGSPVRLAAKRLEGATFPKLILGSTPKVKGLSWTEHHARQAEHLFRYKVPCPHCGERHALEFGTRTSTSGMRWVDHDPETVRHACPHCSALYTQDQYFQVWKRGAWVSQHGACIGDGFTLWAADGTALPWPKRIAFHLWAAYSPAASWPDIVAEYLAAVERKRVGDESLLKTFTNTTLGETYEERADQADSQGIQKRAEPYALRAVPAGGLVLTCGVDVQDNRFECVVWAWGEGEESWCVDYTVLEANPADERDWSKLDDYLQSTFPHAGGGRLKIEAAAVDSGGHFTHQVYAFCRARTGRRVFAIKGDQRQGQPVKGKASWQDVNFRGQVIKRGIKLFHVGTDTAKDLIYGRLKLAVAGPGYMHFSEQLPDAFYQQLTAEARVRQRTASGDAWRWVKTGARNEVLDCTVYAIFAAHMRDVHRYTANMWERVRQAVMPTHRDLFDVQDADAGTPAAAPVAAPAVPPLIHKTPQPMPRHALRPKPRQGAWRATTW